MDQPNFLTFHRDESRHDFYSASRTREPFFDATTQAWVVTDPAHCRELLASAKLKPISYVAHYQALQKRFGIDFSSLIFTFDHMPLTHSGERHAVLRRTMGELLAARKTMIAEIIPPAVARHLARLTKPGEIELMQEVVFPLVHEIMATIADIPRGRECRQASVIFDKSTGIAKRRMLEAELSHLRDGIAERLGAHRDDTQVGIRLALQILGQEPLLGTLGESLRRVLDGKEGLALSALRYPEIPPETGVPVLIRETIEDFSFAGREFEIGNSVRLYLQTFTYEAEDKARNGFFSAGPHTCLGRAIALDIWREMTRYLATLTLTAQVIAYAPRVEGYSFTCPGELRIRLSS